MPQIHQKGVDPPGLLPKRANLFIFGGIAVLVLGMSMFSGRAPSRRTAPTQNEGTMARQSQLKEFQAMLERQRQMQAAKREPPVQTLSERLPAPAAQSHFREEPDPIKELERQRAARAPFAPVMVLRIEEPKETALKDIPPQLVVRHEDTTSVRTGEADVATEPSAGSGKYLPAKEGNLYRVFQGTLIRAKLVNRLDGTLTGPLTCIVTEPLYAKDRKTILVPTDSLLFGEARRVEEAKQQRLAVWFSRLLLPNGYSVHLERTPGLNSVGETGLKDKTNRHYVRRFTLASVVGLIAGLRLYGGRPDPFGYESGVISSVGSTANAELVRRTSDLPTITIREGHVVNVFLTDDLLMPAYQPETEMK